MELVTEWKTLHKYWSVKLNAIGVALLSAMTFLPDQMLAIYNALPQEFKTVIPENAMKIGVILIFIAGIVSRNIKQTKLVEVKGDEYGA